MKTLLLAFVFAVLGCQSCATSPTPAPNGDGGTVTSSCASACAKGTKLKCVWANPTPEGATCVQVCTNAAATVPWNVSALTAATSCQ